MRKNLIFSMIFRLAFSAASVITNVVKTSAETRKVEVPEVTEQIRIIATTANDLVLCNGCAQPVEPVGMVF